MRGSAEDPHEFLNSQSSSSPEPTFTPNSYPIPERAPGSCISFTFSLTLGVFRLDLKPKLLQQRHAQQSFLQSQCKTL